MTKKTTKMLIFAGIAVVAGAGGILLYQKAHAAPAVPTSPLPAGSITPVTAFQKGLKYTFAAQIPAGVTDSAALTAALTNSGWSTPTVLYFMGSGTQPPGFPAIAANGYFASGVWNGADGAAVPAGVVAAATP